MFIIVGLSFVGCEPAAMRAHTVGTNANRQRKRRNTHTHTKSNMAASMLLLTDERSAVTCVCRGRKKNESNEFVRLKNQFFNGLFISARIRFCLCEVLSV